MAMRNPWVLPAAILIMLAVLAVVIFGGEAIRPSPQPQPPPTAILRVPGQYATIQSAIDAARTGDVIQVAAGTYNENLVLNKVVDLVAARPDALNAANNTTVLDGDNGQATMFIPGGLNQRPSINGFVIRNGQYGIDAHSEFIVEDSYFYGSQTAVRYETGSGGVNRGNVYFNSSDDALHVDDASAPLLIESNRFLYAGNDAMELDFLAGAASPVVLDIFNNVLVGSSQDGIKLVDDGTTPQDKNRLVMAAGNLIANNRRAGVGIVHSGNTNEDYSGADAAEAIRLYNNTFYGNDYGISGGDNLVAFNNIIANTSSRGSWRVQGAAGSNSVIAYTLLWQNGIDTDQSSVGLGNITGQDPLFVSAPSPGPDGSWGTVDDDFSGLVLRPGSPAIDRGVAQYTTVSGDEVPASPLTGFTGSAPDLGWREFGGPIAGTGTPIPTRTFGPAVTSTSPVIAPPATLAATGTSASGGGFPTASSTPATATSPGIPATGNGTLTQTPGAPAGSPTATSGPAASATASVATTAAPEVSITSVSPTSAAAGETLTLTVAGKGFEPGLTLAFEGGTGTPPNVIAVQVLDPTTILATTKALNSTAESQTWDVRVDNPDGTSALLESGFTVTP